MRVTEASVFGFTGTRKGMTEIQQHTVEFILFQTGKTLHHGVCIGADAAAHWAAARCGLHIELHPPIITDRMCTDILDWQYNLVGDNWDRGYTVWEPRPYLDRNHDIVDNCDWLIGCPSGLVETVRSGTWATIRYARGLQKDGCIVYPDGTVEPLMEEPDAPE